ncbi:hypothetical protein P8452_50805 [Trifolium repens]|nr:hypothetical protein P8452_50805 [Trifolium repens]
MVEAPLQIHNYNSSSRKRFRNCFRRQIELHFRFTFRSRLHLVQHFRFACFLILQKSLHIVVISNRRNTQRTIIKEANIKINMKSHDKGQRVLPILIPEIRICRSIKHRVILSSHRIRRFKDGTIYTLLHKYVCFHGSKLMKDCNY